MIKFFYNQIFIYLYLKLFKKKKYRNKKWSTDGLPEIEPPKNISKL